MKALPLEIREQTIYDDVGFARALCTARLSYISVITLQLLFHQSSRKTQWEHVMSSLPSCMLLPLHRNLFLSSHLTSNITLLVIFELFTESASWVPPWCLLILLGVLPMGHHRTPPHHGTYYCTDTAYSNCLFVSVTALRAEVWLTAILLKPLVPVSQRMLIEWMIDNTIVPKNRSKAQLVGTVHRCKREMLLWK